ncbi:MAG: exosortase system-associated protein, TIGR04073 family [Nitrosomonas sp.]|nr:exosortase system-associated protein, TIGR04073 family [Nitrosomonas sp.]
MKKTIQTLFALLIIFSQSYNIALAQSYPTKAGEKLGTGVANVVTGVVEIPKTMIIKGHKQGATYGLTAGFFIGIVQAIGRTVSGAIDIATFMVPTTPFIKSELIWDDFDRETTYTKAKMR